MIIFRGHFDGFHVCESTFGNPIRSGNDLLVPAKYLYVLDHRIGKYGEIATGTLIFSRVISSIREVTEYAGDPREDGFKEPYIVNDGPFPLTRKDICESGYFIEGRIDNPYACVNDWIIKAESVEFECEGVYDLKLTSEGCEYVNYRTIEEAMNQAASGQL